MSKHLEAYLKKNEFDVRDAGICFPGGDPDTL